MPKNITGAEPVIDPLFSAGPKLNGGEQVLPEPPPDAPPARARVRRRKGQLPQVTAGRSCQNGHGLEEGFVFCPQCGSPARQDDAPPRCGNGHDLEHGHLFCPQCGSARAQIGTQAPEAVATQLSKEEAHRQAIMLGSQDNSAMAYAPGQAPPGVQTTVIHFLIDGFGAFGLVWYRGQEIELWPGHPRWDEAQAWLALDTAGQYRRFGRQVFAHGPWPGERSYTAAAGRFEKLDGSAGPSEEELRQADEAERRRGRRVPLPLG